MLYPLSYGRLWLLLLSPGGAGQADVGNSLFRISRISSPKNAPTLGLGSSSGPGTFSFHSLMIRRWPSDSFKMRCNSVWRCLRVIDHQFTTPQAASHDVG